MIPLQETPASMLSSFLSSDFSYYARYVGGGEALGERPLLGTANLT